MKGVVTSGMPPAKRWLTLQERLRPVTPPLAEKSPCADECGSSLRTAASSMHLPSSIAKCLSCIRHHALSSILRPVDQPQSNRGSYACQDGNTCGRPSFKEGRYAGTYGACVICLVASAPHEAGMPFQEVCKQVYSITPVRPCPVPPAALQS